MSQLGFEIVEVDLRSPQVAEEFVRVTAESIGRPVTAAHVFQNTFLEGGGHRTLYLAAYQNGELMGFNAFMALQLTWKKRFLPAYQSCWTFTSPRHRGKRVFTSIIDEAKRILHARGAAVIVGFANVVSHPIFVHKLGFSDRGGFVRTNILAVPRLVRRALTTDSATLSRVIDHEALSQNNSELVTLKRPQTHAGGYVEFVDPSVNSGWGKVRSVKRLGVPLNYLHVGGLSLNNPPRLDELILTACRNHPVQVVQFVYHHTSTFGYLFKSAKDSPTVSPMIIHGLNVDEREFETFNFFDGVFDTF